MNETLKPVFLSGDGRLRNGWKIAGFLALLLGVLRVIGIAAHQFHLPPGESLREWILVVPMLLVSWLFMRIEGEPFPSLGWKLNGRGGLDLFLGTLLGIGLIGLAAAGSVASGAVTLVRSGQGAGPMLSGDAFGLEASLIDVIICTLAILVIWKWKGRSVEAGNA